MDLLGYRAFSTELLKIATEVRDPEIRAMIAESNGKEYLQGGRLNANSEVETNFKPKLAEEASRPSYLGTAAKGALGGAAVMGVLGHLANGREGAGIGVGLGALSGALGGLGSVALDRHMRKQAANFMAYTPVGTYNVRGKKPTATGGGYETASNFAGAGLRGGMTGAGAATLYHTLRHGHDFRAPSGLLGKATAAGAGIAIADRALRRHAVKKQLTKMANMGTFSPARQLHATQSRGDFENKVHHTPLKPAVPMIGNNFRPPQGA